MKKWSFYTTNEIKPVGWMRRQLEIQAAGLSGNLDKMWPDVRDSAWIGGDREGWERVPYWLDGFIPLAYLLGDEAMIARAKRYMDAILAAQQEDGWICPCTVEERPTYDSWAIQLIAKVLVVYYECSKDERVPDVVYRVLKNYYDLLKNGTLKLFYWDKARWFETMISISFLYERCAEEWLRELAQILKEQGTHYPSLMEKWIRPINRWCQETHIVNMGMMLKYEAVSCDLLGIPYQDEAEELYQQLKAYNGMPVETFTGDECLSGLSPIQGTELCAVVEQMYSYEHLFAYTGDRKWAERLEVVAFNALPATISDDMWTHQYVQMSNQISCEKFPGRSVFRTNNHEAHIFGLEPNFGCCTANMHQGWPKLVLSSFMHRDDTVIQVVPVPTELNTAAQRISVQTDYPFNNSFIYDVEAKKDFTFQIRIPSFAKSLTVDGVVVKSENLSFAFHAGEVRQIRISFEAPVYMEQRPHGLYAVKRGSLVFSVPIQMKKRMHEYEKNGVERKYPYCDYEYIPCSDWNYAYSSDFFEAEFRGIDSVPFSSEKPPVVVKASVKSIPWGLEDGFETVCAKVPASLDPIGEEKEVELWPYGCAKLRMTELPLV
ncbi:MAG: glycoside hydrolase family 127 protein [Oscillospiraceae bacterium]|nr:glycoside hydrolase family 127 protein [Oscillospiraceae bacterium]